MPDINVKREVMRGSVDLIRHKLFYGHILQQIPKVYNAEKWGIPTMGVGKEANDLLIKLCVNEQFVREIWKRAANSEQARQWLGCILEHEVLHIVFDHLSLQFYDKTRGAVAVDLAVNSYLPEQHLPPGCCFPNDYNLAQGKSAMWYYTHLVDNEHYQKQLADETLAVHMGNQKQQSKGKGGKQGIGGKQGKQEEQGKGGKQGKGGDLDMSGSHEMWDRAAQDPLLKEFCKDLVSKARELVGKEYGDIPGAVIEQIEDLFKKRRPIVPWNKVLRNFAASATESSLDYTMKRVSKRFGTRPGTRKEDVLNLAVAVDTSGSISDSQLVLFFNEVRWIWRNGSIVTVYEADADIQAVYKFKGKFTGEIHGRGGTDLEPVLKETEGKYDALIYFTDFYAPHIDRRYNIPILWVLTTELTRDRFPYKWGRYIKIEDNKAKVA